MAHMKEYMFDNPGKDLNGKALLQERYARQSICESCLQKIFTAESLATNKCFRCRGEQAPHENDLNSRIGALEDHLIISRNNPSYGR